MANCPTCKISLETVRQREGIYYHCSQCDGRAVTMPQIRRITGDRYASGLMRKVKKATQESWRTCPFCQAPMKSFDVSNPPITLDSCNPCVTVWFEAGKFEVLPEGITDSADSLLLTAAESEAKWKIDQQTEREENAMGGPPDESWKWIPAFVGLPIKYYNAEMTGRPWAMWSLSALIIFVSFLAFFNLESAVDTFGMIPVQAWRYGGATFLTSFFLHAGLLHLFGNMYFFLLFGGEVEDFLGWWRFLTLVFVSAIVGDVFHMLGNLHSENPSIGASGGIAGVLAFFAFQFPRAKVGFMFRFRWFRVPAWVAFLLWLLLQSIVLWEQMNGLSHVSAMAHFGGVATGIVLWLLWRNRKSTVQSP